MKELNELGVPKEFWYFFGQILTIPRCSEHEDQIRSYIKQEAVNYGFRVKEDEIGNLFVDKDDGNDSKMKTLIFQSHLDMVCEKNSDVEHDFSSDEIETDVIEMDSERWLTAKGTTLGGDNGVGIAYSLALMDKIHKNELELKNVNIAFLFTVQEENGLIGAIDISDSFIQGDYLINLDSEEDDRFTIGCAGGINTLGLIELDIEEITKVWNESTLLKIRIKGLQGGHSGVDINKGRANAIKILAKILWKMNNKFHIRIKTIKGGNLPNAIPREAQASFYVQKSTVSDLETFFEKIKAEIELGISKVEPDMEILFTQIEEIEDYHSFSEELNVKLLHILYIMPHGPISTHPK
ncbi:MAG: M20/M25/M40 family metallo-hydrolase, partial [Candidatus Lokiarchaeota archaeon]|nr:M20/M25/M40 family metallo-hydrolase [Candidatus Lokiarchaeota archaeon]MBD3199852.1 M20/M25/M40 family metallo-hydrolase [Candidatus Lokiarchaeota archaeon]